MNRNGLMVAAALAALCAPPAAARAEMLAFLNYESMAEDSLDALQLQSGPEGRREGIAVMELDRDSPDYGKILLDIPVPPDTMLHHIFYNKDLTKAYVTALGVPVLHVIDLTTFPYRMKPIPTPGCEVQEDIVFSDDNTRWYLTCMGSSNVVIGDAVADKAIETVAMDGAYPHGIALHEGIDRLLVTNCVAPDMSAVGDTLEIVELSTGRHLGGINIAEKKGAAPVEVLFVPHTDPPVAYITSMMEDALVAAVWNPERSDFDIQKVFDFRKQANNAQMPLEMYFNRAADRLYVTTAEPGHFLIFDMSDGPLAPKLLKQLPTGGGSHHVAITRDERFAYVQNSLLNIPGLSDGTITVIDLERQEVVDSIDTFKARGLTPNSITFLPDWYHQAGHFNNGPGE